MTERVALLVTGLGPGGAETQVIRLAVELSRRGWQPSVISLLSAESRPGLLDEAEIPVYSLHMEPGVPDLRGLWRLARILNRLRPAVLHAHMFHANLLARAARLFCPVPVVISTLHSVAETSRADGKASSGASSRASVRPFLRDLLYSFTDPAGDAVIAVSQAVAEAHASARAVPRRKLSVIPNGVDCSTFRPDPERRARMRRELGLGDEFVWLAAGRLMWKKDFSTLIRAFASVRADAGCGSRLLIAGEGPQESELRRLAAGMEESVRFLGRAPEMPSLLNAADAVALSSVVEGLPMALLEAAASGVPMVATDVGGTPEIVREQETGFLAPTSDVAAFAQAMRKLETAPLPQRLRMANNARGLAESRFEIGAVASRWEDLYRALLEDARRWT